MTVAIMTMPDQQGAEPAKARATRMFSEAAEAPARVAAQLTRNAAVVADLAERLRRSPPTAVVTVARGSSDNAATYARYLIETRLAIMTASAPPSVSSVFTAAPAMAGSLCLAISQSGHSPDLLAAAEAARRGGALVTAMVNDEVSPLAALADIVIPLNAGTEFSVAATKSFITSMSSIAQLVAYWSANIELIAALDALPDVLAEAWDCNWSTALPRLTGVNGLYVIGRGPSLGTVQEAALKLKETCGLHAEAFSSAEVRHGPMALIGPDFPVLAFVPDDAGRDGVDAAVAAARAQGADVITIGDGGLEVPACHPALTPIVQIQAFYRLVNALAVERGFDPDRPPHLAKVTRTQ